MGGEAATQLNTVGIPWPDRVEACHFYPYLNYCRSKGEVPSHRGLRYSLIRVLDDLHSS